ncbi:hypothetical protein Hsar01_03327 [Haloferula sargassicola]|uniref:Uncharacterized protein n=1 Tax=Haloferula sargassicola TaxID=490096 RepID=A0ABP9URB6_9BACT
MTVQWHGMKLRSGFFHPGGTREMSRWRRPPVGAAGIDRRAGPQNSTPSEVLLRVPPRPTHPRRTSGPRKFTPGRDIGKGGATVSAGFRRPFRGLVDDGPLSSRHRLMTSAFRGHGKPAKIASLPCHSWRCRIRQPAEERPARNGRPELVHPAGFQFSSARDQSRHRRPPGSSLERLDRPDRSVRESGQRITRAEIKFYARTGLWVANCIT